MVQNVQTVQAVQVVCPHPDLPRGGVRKRILCPRFGGLKRGGSPVSHSVACRRKDRHHPTKCNAELGDGLNGLNDWNVLNKRAVPVP